MVGCSFLGGAGGEEPTCQSSKQETRVPSLAWEDPLEKGTASHFSILAWKIPQTEEPGRLQSIGSQRSDLVCMHAWWAAVSHLLTDMSGSLSWKDPQAIIWLPPLL